MAFHQDAQERPQAEVRYSLNTYSFLWGFIPGPRLPAATELCQNGSLASAEFEMNAADVLLATATLGVFVPEHLNLVCLKK